VIAQGQNVLLENEGDLAVSKWVSLVDATLGPTGNPCGNPIVAAAAADNQHSGPIQAEGATIGATPCCTGNGKIIKVPQSSSATTLDATKTYAICYTDTGGTTSDTWYNSNITIRVSKLQYISAYGVKHKTMGTIPHQKTLTMWYGGTILYDRWISLVDATLNNNHPCDDGNEAATSLDEYHSGPLSAVNNKLVVNTERMKPILMAVCYAESGGIATSVWRDSGIRVTRSAITEVQYGVDTVRFGFGGNWDKSRLHRWTKNRNTDDHNTIMTDKIAQHPGVKLQYRGELPNDSYIALVDDSLMDPDDMAGNDQGNPCMYPSVAAAAANSLGFTDGRITSGAMLASQLDGTPGGKIFMVPQTTGNLLDIGTVTEPKSYAVCYATGDGSATDSTWADSYVRFELSKIETLGHHSMLHLTHGQLPYTAGGLNYKLTLTYTGSLAMGTPSGDIKIAFVEQTKNPMPTLPPSQHAPNTVTIPKPCLTAAFPNAASDGTGLQSGPISATSSYKNVKVDTTVLHTGTVSGTTYTATEFAVCYSDSAGADWRDSGQRLNIGKIDHLLHGTPTDGPFSPLAFYQEETNGNPNGIASARQTIPQAINQEITYVSPSQIGGVLGNGAYVSLVDASINANKPCSSGTEAAGDADSQHSGTVQAVGKVVTVPQTTFLDDSKIFAVCYSVSTGSIADPTWADTYVRIKISKVQSITSLGVTHKVGNYVDQIASMASSTVRPTGVGMRTRTEPGNLELTYAGSLQDNMYISVVDQTLGSLANFPCADAAHERKSSQHSGTMQAGQSSHVPYVDENGNRETGVLASSARSVVLHTDEFDAGVIMSVCYSENNATWYDSGIRLRVAKVSTLTMSSGHVAPEARVASPMLTVRNKIPSITGQKFTYTGALDQDKWMSVVDVSEHGGNPCVYPSTAALVADATHSGSLQGTQDNGSPGGKVITLPQSTLLDATKTYTVCYAEVNGFTSDAWFDSYIRFKISKVSRIQHNVGVWTGSPAIGGEMITHVTMGQLPNVYSGATGHTFTYGGALATGKSISLVDDLLGQETIFGMNYYNPCRKGGDAAHVKDSRHSGPLTAGASDRDINSLDSTVLDTSLTYALCFTEGDGSVSAAWIDSGIRFTFPKVIAATLASGHSGIRSRDMTSIFYPSNTLPQTTNVKFNYVGDLGTDKFISVVDASLGGSNPCVDGSEATAAANSQHSGILSAAVGTSEVTLPQLSTASQLSKTVTFAVCYSETGDATGWFDSYIRIKPTLVSYIQVDGIKISTSGAIPSVQGTSTYKISYGGTLANNKWISLVDESTNVNQPCEKGHASVNTGVETQRTGPQQALSAKIIRTFDTSILDTSKTFAVCYSEVSGLGSDSTWGDSGIRLTVTKVWNMIYSSGAIGPACAQSNYMPSGALNPNCKLDTKARDMTSIPKMTNVLPQEQNMQLTYAGTLAAGQYISLVAFDLLSSNAMGSNPCADGSVAGAAADQYHSGPIKADPSSGLITIPQSTLLSATKTYAVCYDDATNLPPHHYSTKLSENWNADPTAEALTGLEGTAGSSSWRDSYIRIRVVKVTSLSIGVSNMPVANTFKYTQVLTFGMIPNQAGNQQAQYVYSGSLATNRHLAIVDDSTHSGTDTNTGVSRNNPCGTPSNAYGMSNSARTGAHQAPTSSKTIVTIDTKNYLTDTTKTFALCYSEDFTSNFVDSGIRLTVPELMQVNYLDDVFGNPSTVASYTRSFTSLVTTRNVIPQALNQKLTYSGALAAEKWVSLVDIQLNDANPCVNPVVATGTADSQHSGVMQASSAQKTVTVLNNPLLDQSHEYALCYAKTDGSNSDTTWRDSYIRIKLTQVQHITSYLVTHKVYGQLPNHNAVKIEYAGSLAANQYVILKDEALNPTTVGTGSYNFPCADNTAVATTTKVSSAAGSSTIHGGPAGSMKEVAMDTTALSTEKIFAVCYAADVNDISTYFDSGIRVTLPAVYNIQAESGYSGVTQSATVTGIPNRNQYSLDQIDANTLVDRPTNRLANAINQKLVYVVHPTWSATATNKWISIVDSSLHSNNPCVNGAIINAGEDTQHSTVMQGIDRFGNPGGTVVTVPQTTLLDATKTFAVCYSLNNGGAGGDWRDTYVRLKISQLESMVASSVTHRTVGQIPNVVSTDGMSFTYTGSLGNNAWISFVQYNVNDLNVTSTVIRERTPCVGSFAGNSTRKLTNPTQYSGAHQAGVSDKIITDFNTQNMGTDRVFALCYASGSGDTSDGTWSDSGIRVTVPRVWNMRFSSGHIGPACPIIPNHAGGYLPTGCKVDTKDREMTSFPLATNRFPSVANQAMSYVGTMAENMYMSLVDASANEGNPCVSSILAAGTPASNGGTDLRTVSGPVQATGNTVTIPQGTNDLLDVGITYAVCYNDGQIVYGAGVQYVSENGADVLRWGRTTVYQEGLVGTMASQAWRDTYIRLKISRVEQLAVRISNVPISNTYTDIPIRTVGQIANHEAFRQITYVYSGSLLDGKFFSLVDSTDGITTDGITGISRPDPCATNAIARQAADGSHSGTFQATSGTKHLDALNTKSGGGLGLSGAVTFALCYFDSDTNGAVTRDSGLRISVPKIHTITNIDPTQANHAGDKMRYVTSEVTAQSKLAQEANQRWSYVGTLVASKYISLVDASANNWNPCANRELAAGPASSTTSGVVQADANKLFIVPQTILLDASKIYTTCYAEVDGSKDDVTWRDSYVRVTMSKIETFTTAGVTHRTYGHIPSAASLQMVYTGSLPRASGAQLTIVQASLNPINVGWAGLGSVTYGYPCMSEAIAEATTSGTNAHSTVDANHRNFMADTTALDRSANNQYAICYTLDDKASSGTVWADAGIRFTVSEVIAVTRPSGYTGPSDNPYTMPNYMGIEPTPRHVLPRAENIALTYVAHASSPMGNNKWLALVDATQDLSDPCSIGANIAASADTLHSGALQAAGGTSNVVVPQSTDASLLDHTKTFAICYAKVNGLASDATWKDSYLRLAISKVESIEALGVRHRSIGHLPNAKASDMLELHYHGTLAANKHIVMVDQTGGPQITAPISGLSTNYPCQQSTTALTRAADCANSGVCKTGTNSGVQTAAYNNTITSLDTTGMSVAITFAVCYASGDGTAADAWFDTGIRVTMTKLHSLRETNQGYSGATHQDRIMTSFPLPTNRLIRGTFATFNYGGDIAVNSKVSVVALSVNSGNPCVDPTHAAATANYGATPADQRLYTGVATASGTQVVFGQITGNLLYFGTPAVAQIYTVCYSEGVGDVNDNGWRDSYIRLKLSEVESIATKGVTHRTTGQLPRHIAGLTYSAVTRMGIAFTHHISLVDATLGTATSGSIATATGWAKPIVNPCECQGAACSTTATATADATHSGKAVHLANSNNYVSLDTQSLSSSALFALCYSDDSLNGNVHTGNWFDSGIRLTVSKIKGIYYSGLPGKEALSRNKLSKLITSTVMGTMQTTSQIVSTVLPQMLNLPLVYDGELQNSAWLSLVSTTQNNGNPCASGAEAAASADDTHSGSLRACRSFQGLCDPTGAGVGADADGTKEFFVPMTTLLNPLHTFTLCYSYADGGTQDTTWHDSFIRVSISEITKITASGVTHTVNGVIADHPATQKLSIEYFNNYGSGGEGYSISLVDETLNSRNPCISTAIAGATSDGQHSGAFIPSSGTTVPITTESLSTTVQFALCFAKPAGTLMWKDSGIRLIKSKLKTVVYNNAQPPLFGGILSQFRRETTTSETFLGSGPYQVTYGHTTMSILPQLASDTAVLPLSYTGDLGAGQYVALVQQSANYGDPCSTAPIAGQSAGLTGTGWSQSNAQKEFALTRAVMNGIDPSVAYTMCYSETTTSAVNPVYPGHGQQATGWRDSYVRFKISMIQRVTHHGVVHATAGVIANNGAFALTYEGTLGAGSYISLVTESTNNGAPCASGADAAGTPADSRSGPVLGPEGEFRVIMNTLTLTTSTQLALCYASRDSGGNTSSTWMDSGIRLQVSGMTTLTYNNAQSGTITGQHERIMDSSNLCYIDGVATCSDTSPLATNIMPSTIDSLGFIYEGNKFANPAAVGSSFPINRHISFVDASLSNTPCADRAIAASAQDVRHSGKLTAGAFDRSIGFSQVTALLDPSKTYTVCYATGDGSAADTSWRDSYIRLKVSKIFKLTSYGIEHFTDGGIATRAHLRVLTTGQFANAKPIALVEHKMNNYQPCVGTQATQVPNSNTSMSYSGVSTDNVWTGVAGENKHTLNTESLPYTKMYALCYAEGDGAHNDTTWTDSGLRLQTPRVTALQYAVPTSRIEASTCFGAIDLYGLADCKSSITGDGPTATIGSGQDSVRNAMIPRGQNVVVTYWGRTGYEPTNGIWISLVEHTQHNNNPCRKGQQAAAGPAAAGTSNNRFHSGSLQAAAGTNAVTIPQATGGGTTNDLLDYTKTFAVCYADANGGMLDESWRDSYVRVTLGYIQTLIGSDMIVYTRGIYANVPSLKIEHTGTLGYGKYLSIIDERENSFFPCEKEYAGASAFHQPWSTAQDSTTVDNKRSPALQAGAGSRQIDFDTTKLSDNGAMYTVCYATGTGDDTDITWTDSGIKLRFLKWNNPGKTRIVSGAPVRVSFTINYGSLSAANDRVVFLRDSITCENAPFAQLQSNGTMVRRTINDHEYNVAMPTGENGDLALLEGTYTICFFDGDSGDGGCDHGNEFIKVNSGITGLPITVIPKPRLGRVAGLSHIDSVRAISGKSHTYSIKGSTNTGYEVRNQDKIFFREGDCNSLPVTDSAYETGIITTMAYDTDPTSSTYKAARVALPSGVPLTSNGAEPRNLVACFATLESLYHGDNATDFVQLDDGLEVIQPPRIGSTLADFGHMRAVTDSSPSFFMTPLKPGDQVYWKLQAVQGVADDNDCIQGAPDVYGNIISPIPNVTTASETVMLSPISYVGLNGKINLPLELSAITEPKYFSTCYIPAGTIEKLINGANCPLDQPNSHTNPNGGTCGSYLSNAVRLQDDLQVFPEPTEALVTQWFKGEIYELLFNKPRWGVAGTKHFATGQAGDIVVFHRDSCDDAHTIHKDNYYLGVFYSMKMTLSQNEPTDTGNYGGSGKEMAVAFAKLNELPAGSYRICYATKESKGDDAGDFKELVTATLHVDPEPVTAPVLTVPRTVQLGQNLVIHWESIAGRVQGSNSWIGLYYKGTCMPTPKRGEFGADVFDDGYSRDYLQEPTGADVEHSPHECYKTFRFIKEGTSSGTVMFSPQEYKVAGEYDVRFFQGDSRNGQGIVCKGLLGSDQDSYVKCSLEASLVSSPIHIYANNDMLDDLDAIPGMEAYFDSDRGRFKKDYANIGE